MTRLSNRRVLSAALAVLLTGTALLGSSSSPASGQSIDDKREEARQVAARLDQLSARYERLQDRSNEAQAELSQVQERIAQAQARLDDTVRQRDQHKQELQDYAVDAYLGGPDNSALTLAVDSRDEREMPVRLGYLDSISGNRTQLIEQLQATEDDVSDRVADLQADQQTAQHLVDRIAQAADDAQQAIDEQQQLQSQVDAELQQLIDEQRAREAAARAAAAAAAARQAAAARAAAQPPAADPGNGGTSGGGTTGGGTTGGGGGGTTTTPSDPPYTPPPAASGAQVAVDAARSREGRPYVWAGSGPDQFDCSGLTMWSWAQAGRSLSHSSRYQYTETRRVSSSDLQPGDLVFYGSPAPGGIYHVAMYIGGGMVVHAPHSGDVVREASMYSIGSPSGYGRP